MVDFQTQISSALKGRKENENAKTIGKKFEHPATGAHWFYHVFFAITEDELIEIIPRKVFWSQQNGPDAITCDGHFGTIAVDQEGRFGFVVCSQKDNFDRKEGRRLAVDNLIIAQINQSGLWNYGPTNFYVEQPIKLTTPTLRIAVAEALAKFLTDGLKKRS